MPVTEDGKIVMNMKGMPASGNLRYKGYTGEGTAYLDEDTVDIPYSYWNQDVGMILKRFFVKHMNLPEDFKITIEW